MIRTARRLMPTLTCVASLSGCAVLSGASVAPRVSLNDLRPTEIGLIEQRYGATLRVQNPNDVGITVNGMEYTIYINERKFADGVHGQSFSVPAYSEKLVRVNLTSSMLRVMDQLKDLSGGERAVFRYRLEGSLKVAGTFKRLPFSHEDRIDLSGGGDT